MSADVASDPAEQVVARLPVTDRRLWLWLVGVGLVVVGGLLWMILGRAPEVAVGRGMIVPTFGFVEVGSFDNGQVTEILVEPGNVVDKGQVVARLTNVEGREVDVLAPARGQIGTVTLRQGAISAPGEPIMTLDPTDDGNVATAYIPAEVASRVRVGMPATVAIASAPTSEFGSITGTVSEVAALPATADRISLVVGTNDQLPAFFLADGPVVEVTVTFDKDPTTPSGYTWTSGQGYPGQVRTGTLATVTVTLADDTLISRLAR